MFLKKAPECTPEKGNNPFCVAEKSHRDSKTKPSGMAQAMNGKSDRVQEEIELEKFKENPKFFKTL